MFYWVAKNSKFPANRWRFDNTDPHCSVSLSKSNIFVSIYCKLKTNFIAKSQYILYLGFPLTRERKQKKNPIFIFKSVRVRLRANVRLRDCANEVFDWEVKRGFEKASVSRAVRLRECPLAMGELTVPYKVAPTFEPVDQMLKPITVHCACQVKASEQYFLVVLYVNSVPCNVALFVAIRGVKR